MNDQIILAIIGAGIGMVTAIITSWLNKRAFREEIAESDILKTQLEDYKSIWEIVTKVNYESIQLLGWMSIQVNDMRKSGVSEDKIISVINKEFNPKSIDILKNTMSLNKYFISIPADLVESLKCYESSIWTILKQHKFDKYKDIIDESEKVFNSIRNITAKLVKRELKISDSIGEIPEGGYVPEYIKDAFK